MAIVREALVPEREDRFAVPVLDEYFSVRDHLHGRLCREVKELESRIQCLKDSPSPHSDTIIRTYQRMITQKRRFMSQWGMEAGSGTACDTPGG
ncbi:MAG: hypothetical protein R3296_05425 [Oleiphilaceae bacterium]|nr:hypothetical protein [Oleiphilaceae bacterium]